MIPITVLKGSPSRRRSSSNSSSADAHDDVALDLVLKVPWSLQDFLFCWVGSLESENLIEKPQSFFGTPFRTRGVSTWLLHPPANLLHFRASVFGNASLTGSLHKENSSRWTKALIAWLAHEIHVDGESVNSL